MVVSVSFPIQMALSASSVREGESAQVKTQKDTAAGISCYQSFTTTYRQITFIWKSNFLLMNEPEQCQDLVVLCWAIRKSK